MLYIRIYYLEESGNLTNKKTQESRRRHYVKENKIIIIDNYKGLARHTQIFLGKTGMSLTQHKHIKKPWKKSAPTVMLQP